MKHTETTASDNPVAIVDREKLKAAIATAGFAVDNKNTIPILSNLMLTADCGELVIVGTDLDIEIRVRVEADVDGRFSATMPANLLHNMCAKAPKSDRVSLTLIPSEPEMIPVIGEDGKVETDADGKPVMEARQYNSFISDQASVSLGKTKYTLNTLPPDDFPVLERFQGNSHRFGLAGSILWNCFDAVMGAISVEETRYYLNGVFLYVHPGAEPTLRTVATDGHRLYCQQIDAPKGCEDMPAIIIPRKMVSVLHRLLKGKVCPRWVEVRVEETAISVSFGGVTILSKTIDGQFPDYVRVIPTGNDKVATIKANDLAQAVAAVTVISSERGRAVKLTFEDDACRLDVANPDSGNATTSVSCPHGFEMMEIGLNAVYLADIITKACPTGGDIEMKLADAGGPVLITGTEHMWMGVLMPMRV